MDRSIIGRHSNRRPSSSSSSSSSSAAAFALLTLLLVLDCCPLCLQSSSGHLGSMPSSESLCDLSRCWELYTSAQESLEIHDDYPPTRLRSLSADAVAVRCVAFRTFFLCLRNMSRTCLGDLSFHSAHKGVEKQMRTYNCSASGRVFQPPASASSSSSASSSGHPKDLPVCSLRSSSSSSSSRQQQQQQQQRSLTSYEHCSVFGDPHVRTFAGAFVTCHLEGAWPLVDNDYLTVQVTSESVGADHGSAVTKVTVLIKRHDECAVDRYVTYQASSGDLPATFDDGSRSFGRWDAVSLRELKTNRHVEIYVRYIDTRVIVRLQGRYFAVSLRMPTEIVNETRQQQQGANGLQLCLRGCPGRLRIDIDAALLLVRGSDDRKTTAPAMGVQEALVQCQAQGLRHYYLDSCVFDLVTTGDYNFTLLSSLAFADAILLLPESASKADNRTTLSFSSGQHRVVVVDCLFLVLLPLVPVLVLNMTFL